MITVMLGRMDFGGDAGGKESLFLLAGGAVGGNGRRIIPFSLLYCPVESIVGGFLTWLLWYLLEVSTTPFSSDISLNLCRGVLLPFLFLFSHSRDSRHRLIWQDMEVLVLLDWLAWDWQPIDLKATLLFPHVRRLVSPFVGYSTSRGSRTSESFWFEGETLLSGPLLVPELMARRGQPHRLQNGLID